MRESPALLTNLLHKRLFTRRSCNDSQKRRIWNWGEAVDSLGNTTSYTVNMYSASGQKLGAYLFAPGTTSQQGLYVAMINVTISATDQYFGSRRLAVIDQLGSAGTYYPWGEVKGGTNPQNAWSFATYWQDSVSGLDYAQNRYYSNIGGRFTTPDPSRSSGGPSNPQSWNRYAYTRGDPVNRNDPGGLEDEGICDEDGNECGDGGGDLPNQGYCDPSIGDCDSTCVSGGGFTEDPNPYCQSSGAPPSAPTSPTATAPCNTDVPKIDTTLTNLGEDILGIAAQDIPGITQVDFLALTNTIDTDISDEEQDPMQFFNGGHFSLDLTGASIASDLGGPNSLAYSEFEQLFNPKKKGKRYDSPVPTTDPNHTYYLHDHADKAGDLSFHFDRFNPYIHLPIGAIQHGAVDVLYGHLGTHCLDPAWR